MNRATMAALAAATLLATACGSTSQRTGISEAASTSAPTGSSAATSGLPRASDTPGGPGAGTAAAPGSASAVDGGSAAAPAPGAGGASTSGQIEIGFLNTKVSNAAAAGLNTGETYTPRKIFETVVASMNEHGGLAGRKIVPVVADTDTATARWEADYQAACAQFTQDNKVSAVVGYSFALIDSFESCLTKAGVVHLNGAYTIGDQTTLDSYPALFGTTNPTTDRRYHLQLDGPVRAGYLTKSNRLGLLLDSCPTETRAYTRTIAPYIKAHGLTVASKEVMDCPNGATDVSGVVAQINNAVLKFRSARVDRAFVEGIPFILFANNAESQGWHPGYLLTSTTGGRALAANSVPKAQLENIRAYGWLPVIDVSEGSQPSPTPPQQRCLSMLKAKGVIPKQYNDFLSSYTTCDAMFLYETALRKTSGVASAAVVRSAIESLGTTYESASVLDAKATFSAARHEAPTVYRPWSYRNSCDCFAYTGPARTF